MQTRHLKKDASSQLLGPKVHLWSRAEELEGEACTLAKPSGKTPLPHVKSYGLKHPIHIWIEEMKEYVILFLLYYYYILVFIYLQL